MNNNRNLLIAFFFVVLAVIGISGYAIYSTRPAEVAKNETQQPQPQEPEPEQLAEITISGTAGQTALELLESDHIIDITVSDTGKTISSIDGVEATGNQTWVFYVNGEKSSIAPDDYQTQTGDELTWKLENI
jgi:hypothetical protein